MIGRILYRESCQGVLSYVFGKAGMRIIGYGNMCSQDISKKFFGSVLHFQGQRNATKNRYAHITLNLPIGEHLDDKTFYKVSKEYMDQMGYGEQPYAVVRHNDTKHEHVHIVTTNVDAKGKVLGIFNSYRRNVATQHHLEKKFNLSLSPETRQDRELPIYRDMEHQFGMDDSQGTKFYMQDVLNSTLQKYKVRSFTELAILIKPYHIETRQTINATGRIGISFGLNNQKGYQTRFINGSTVHPRLSGPKLQEVFEKNKSSKLLPMVKKRLEKQIRTTYKLFRTISPEDLPDILKSHQNLDCLLNYDENGKAVDFTIYDKSGYVLKSNEIADDIGIQENPGLFESENSQIHAESEQLGLELQNCIKEAYRTTYQNSGSKTLYSEHIDRIPVRFIVTEMAKSERFQFLIHYLHMDDQKLGKLIQGQFDIVKDKLSCTESIKEERGLIVKAELIKQAIEKQVFEPTKQMGIRYELIQSLGTRYDNGILTYSNSQKHKVQLDIGQLQLPDKIDFYASPSFVKTNEKVLEGLLNDRPEKEIKPSPTAIFLPLMFPNVYKAMTPIYKQRFDKLALKAYCKYAERMHAPFEKSPKDYIQFFNAKGFHFERKEEKLCIASIYSKESISVPLPKKTQAYLESSNDLNKTLANQPKILEDIRDHGRDNLKSLWSAHLMERGQYKKAAYLYVLEGAVPNLPLQIMEHHMENGFREALVAVSKEQVDAEQASILRRGMYALSNFLGSKSFKEEEPYNGFKDEMTDWSKYKGRGLSI